MAERSVGTVKAPSAIVQIEANIWVCQAERISQLWSYLMGLYVNVFICIFIA